MYKTMSNNRENDDTAWKRRKKELSEYIMLVKHLTNHLNRTKTDAKFRETSTKIHEPVKTVYLPCKN